MNKKKSKVLAFLLAASLLIPSANGIVSAAELEGNTDTVLEDSLVTIEPSLEEDKVVESDKVGKSWGADYDTATTFTINSLEELKAFRDLVNNGKDFEGKTVNLNANIDLNSEEWTPIGNGSRLSTAIVGRSFKGTFNGNGYTVSKLKITSGEKSSLIGFFGGLNGATVKNINFENVSIIKSKSANVGTLAGIAIGNSYVYGINVNSGELEAVEVGGVVGRLIKDGTIESCSNKANITGTSIEGAAAGIVAKAYYTEENKEMNIINCTNEGTIKGKYAVGGIVGFSAANIKKCKNSGNVSDEATSTGATGGISGVQEYYGKIVLNTNTGNISGKSSTGGIVGWTRYESPVDSYKRKDIISVSSNKNTGNIQTNAYETTGDRSFFVGGIVGKASVPANIYNNENIANEIKILKDKNPNSKLYAAGIVGGVEEWKDHKFNDSITKVYDNINTTDANKIFGNEYDDKNEKDPSIKFPYVNNIRIANDNKKNEIKNNVNKGVASANGMNYVSLETAIKECEKEETVTLLEGVTIDSPIVITERESIKIDFNKNEVKASEEFNGDSLINIENSNGIALYNGNFVVGDKSRKAIELNNNSSASMNGDFKATTDGKENAPVMSVNGSTVDVTGLDSINGKGKDALGDDEIITSNNGSIVDNENTTPSIPSNPSIPSKPSKPVYTHEEIIGSDRYDTAVKIADKLGSYDNVVLVNATSTMSDGLSASGLAGKENGAILLTKKDSIPQATMDRIRKVKKVYIIGGEAAISAKVENEITAAGIKVERLGGKDRVETSKLVAEKLGNYSDAFVVNGFRGEADAMSASSVAARYGAPILLTNGKESTHAKKSGVEYYVIGGNAVVDKSIAEKYDAEVLAGKDRYATNREVIAEFYSGSDKLYLANGDKLVDALTASPLAKNHGIVLVNEKSDKSVLKDKNTVQVGGMDFEIEFEK